jgi:hypothetical protein
MKQVLNSPRPGKPATEHTTMSNLAFGVCSALMPYLLATLLLIAFG